MRSPSSDEFFVGYLPTPPRLRILLRRATAALLLVAIATAGVIASRQRDPGAGRWHDQEQTFDGVLIRHPYPMLQLNDGTTLLLVAEGKHAVTVSPSLVEGRYVSGKGTIIDRSGLRMLELVGELTAASERIAHVDAATSVARSQQLRGEIVDPKCFLGAMKPGNGKTHKGCAALCLRGGIPPAFVSDGQFYLLADKHGNALTGESLDRVIAFVSDPVEITATETARAGIHFLQLDTAQIRRL